MVEGRGQAVIGELGYALELHWENLTWNKKKTNCSKVIANKFDLKRKQKNEKNQLILEIVVSNYYAC